MGLKENFNQAIREIIHGEVPSEPPVKTNEINAVLQQNDTLGNMLGETSEFDNTDVMNAVNAVRASKSAEASAEANSESGEETPAQKIGARFADYSQFSNPYISGDNVYSDTKTEDIVPPPIQPRAQTPSYTQAEETTLISKNTVISGGTITGFANVRIDGGLKGDVKISKDCSVTGKIVGDIECNNAVMSGSAIQGTVATKGQVRMDRDSVILGNINTQYLDMNGRIKGDIDVSGKAEFKSDSVIVGNINASTITVLDGAVIKGYINTTFLQDQDENSFPDTITVVEN